MSSFERFYRIYPRHTARGAAEKAFEKIKPDDELLNRMIAAIGRQKRFRAECQVTNKFVPDWPHPSTWLNQKRWLDEVGSDVEERPEKRVYFCQCGKVAVLLKDDANLCARCATEKMSLGSPTGISRLREQARAMGLGKRKDESKESYIERLKQIAFRCGYRPQAQSVGMDQENRPSTSENDL